MSNHLMVMETANRWEINLVMKSLLKAARTCLLTKRMGGSQKTSSKFGWSDDETKISTTERQRERERQDKKS